MTAEEELGVLMLSKLLSVLIFSLSLIWGSGCFGQHYSQQNYNDPYHQKTRNMRSAPRPAYQAPTRTRQPAYHAPVTSRQPVHRTPVQARQPMNQMQQGYHQKFYNNVSKSKQTIQTQTRVRQPTMVNQPHQTKMNATNVNRKTKAPVYQATTQPTLKKTNTAQPSSTNAFTSPSTKQVTRNKVTNTAPISAKPTFQPKPTNTVVNPNALRKTNTAQPALQAKPTKTVVNSNAFKAGKPESSPVLKRDDSKTSSSTISNQQRKGYVAGKPESSPVLTKDQNTSNGLATTSNQNTPSTTRATSNRHLQPTMPTNPNIVIEDPVSGLNPGDLETPNPDLAREQAKEWEMHHEHEHELGNAIGEAIFDILAPVIYRDTILDSLSSPDFVPPAQTVIVNPAPVINVQMPNEDNNNVPAPMNNVAAPLNNVPAPMSNVQPPMENVAAPMNNAGAPMNNAAAPMNNVAAPMNNVAAPMANVPAPMNNVSNPTENVPSPMKNAPAPMENVKLPGAVKVKSKKGDVKSQPMEEDATTNNSTNGVQPQMPVDVPPAPQNKSDTVEDVDELEI